MSRQRIVTYGPDGFNPSKRNNNIMHEETVETPDSEPMIDDRISALETELAAMRERVNNVTAANTEVNAMRDAIVGKPK